MEKHLKNDYRYILFDLDGTLVDSGPGILGGIRYMLDRFGLREDDPERLRAFIGPPIVDSLVQRYGFTREDGLRALGYYREYYSETGVFQAKAYPGVREMLARLKDAGRTLSLATNKPEYYAEIILKNEDLARYFDFVGGTTLDQKRTQKPEVIRHVIASLRIPDRAQVLMVGDRDNDVLGAAQAGVDCLGILYGGYGTRKELETAGADGIAETPARIADMILGKQ